MSMAHGNLGECFTLLLRAAEPVLRWGNCDQARSGCICSWSVCNTAMTGFSVISVRVSQSQTLRFSSQTGFLIVFVSDCDSLSLSVSSQLCRYSASNAAWQYWSPQWRLGYWAGLVVCNVVLNSQAVHFPLGIETKLSRRFTKNSKQRLFLAVGLVVALLASRCSSWLASCYWNLVTGDSWVSSSESNY